MTIRRLLASLLLAAALVPAASAQQPPAEPQDEFVPVSELPPAEQLPSAPLLIAAYAFAWIAIGSYVVSVARRLSGVQREVERLDSDVKRSGRT